MYSVVSLAIAVIMNSMPHCALLALQFNHKGYRWKHSSLPTKSQNYFRKILLGVATGQDDKMWEQNETEGLHYKTFFMRNSYFAKVSEFATKSYYRFLGLTQEC